MRIAAVLFYCLCMLPVRLDFVLFCAQDRLPHGKISLYCVPLRKQVQFQIIKQNHQFYIMLSQKKYGPLHLPTHRKKPSLMTVFPPFKQYLLTWKKNVHLLLHFQFGFHDAAHSALMCAALRSALSTLPSIAYQIMPNYQAPGFDLHFRCISFFRLGKLLLTFCLLGMAWLKRWFCGRLDAWKS